MDQDLIKRCSAEAFGTAVLILVGCAAIAIGAQEGRTFVNVIGIAFAFGLSVTAMAYAVGPISGCHINPAVSVAMLCAGRMTARETIAYIIAQMVGALIGAGLLVVIVKGKISGYDIAAAGLGQNGWGAGYLGQYGLGAALITEFLATFIFIVVILSATHPTANIEVAGLIIGLTLFMLHFAFINVTGLSVNPARSFGPAVFVGGKALAQLWLFLVVPTVAGAAAGMLFRWHYPAMPLAGDVDQRTGALPGGPADVGRY
jgi:aquaporin Z